VLVSEVEEPAVEVQELLALGGRRRKAVQSGGIFRAVLAELAHPDAPIAAPRLAELHKPTQGLIRAGHGCFASSPGNGG
jgi:hypothetical protein